jgi:type II secretory pathway pseudopilin PulG
MAIPFTCPHCGAQTNVDDRFAGQTGPCSHCGKVISIPMPAGFAQSATPPARSGSSWIVLVAVIVGGGFVLLACAGILIALLLPAIQVARNAARQAQSINNIKQINLALLNYETVHGTFPPAYIADENGRPMHSWRVLILPYMEQKALYDQYDFNEPWDGPNNSRLHSLVMPVFVDPSAKGEGTYTSYVAITGNDTMFPGAEAVALDDIPDGASNTISVVSIGNSDILWCEPRDLEFDTMSFTVQDPGPGAISSDSPGAVPVGFVDGRATKLGENIDSGILKSLILRNDGAGELPLVP